MSTFLIFAHRYTTIDGHFVDLYATRLTNFYVNVNNMATAMPQSTRAPPGGDNCAWRTLLLSTENVTDLCKLGKYICKCSRIRSEILS